ncbi:SapC family protein [Pseudomonas putida]|uniref:SapC family protein n=1 Tax=Pseudomonas putida TaxID=303 RepID=UPI00370A4804
MPNYVPISHETFADKSWVRPLSLKFAQHDVIAPLFADEAAEAMHSLPLAFVEQDQGFALVALMGLKPEENLLVSPEGNWLVEYVPVTYRSRPFRLIEVADQAQQVLCIDQDSVRDDQQGEPFFEDGKITDFISQILEREQKFTAHRQLTRQICTLLQELDLIKPWNLVVDEDGEERQVGGLFRIDEVALNTLSQEDFFRLRQNAAFPVIYSQLLSARKIHTLAALFRHRPRPQEGSKNETFDFAGI